MKTELEISQRIKKLKDEIKVNENFISTCSKLTKDDEIEIDVDILKLLSQIEELNWVISETK